MTACVKVKHGGVSSHSKISFPEADPVSLVASQCTECGLCTRECGFLQRHGMPGVIAGQHLAGIDRHLATAFFCSLCKLCSQICPQQLPVAEMFLDLRRQAVLNGQGNFREHRRLRRYEAIGNSRLFTSYLVPEHCTTVFFPGCALPGIRPEQTLRLFQFLQGIIPQLGLVLDCCNKPSHDLGHQRRFRERFSRKIQRLRCQGVEKVITGCPSCLQVFRQYGEGLDVTTMYTHLAGQTIGNCAGLEFTCTIHDPCTVRFESEILQAVRDLVRSMGGQITEMGHTRETTLCCGEGGGASCLAEGKVSAWKTKRLKEAGDLPVLTFCAGCTMALASERTSHLLDLLFPPPEKRNPAAQVRVPFTYLNRLFFKRETARLFGSQQPKKK